MCMYQIAVIRFGGFDSLDLIGNRSCLIHTEKWAFRFSQDENFDSVPLHGTSHRFSSNAADLSGLLWT